jgi:hypothetical protein
MFTFFTWASLAAVANKIRLKPSAQSYFHDVYSASDCAVYLDELTAGEWSFKGECGAIAE